MLAQKRRSFVRIAMKTQVPDFAIAKELKISTRQVYRIRKSLGVKRKIPLKTGLKPGSTYVTISKGDIERIIHMANAGVSQMLIARMIGVSQPAVHYILKRKKAK